MVSQAASYMPAAFKPVAQQGTEIWISPPHVTKGGSLPLPGSRVYVASI